MTINRTTLSAFAIVGSLMMSTPVFANDDYTGRDRRMEQEEAAKNLYSGSEGTVEPMKSFTPSEQPMTDTQRERIGNSRN